MFRKLGMVLLGLLFVSGFVSMQAFAFGSWRALLAEPARLSFVGGMTVLAVLTGSSDFNFSAGQVSDLANNWIFLPLLIQGTALGFAAAYCDRHALWVFKSPAIRWIGVAVFSIGLALRIAAMRILGNRFSIWVAVQDSHSLVTSGLYRYVRHPSYTGATAALIGSALVFRSELALAIAVSMLLPLIPRMAAEENLLLAQFGIEYLNYRHQSWRILPWIY